MIFAGMAYNTESSLNDRNIQMLEEHNQIMQEVANQHESMYIEMQTILQHYPEWFVDPCHLRNHGNKLKANWLANAIAKQFYQKPLFTASQQSKELPSIKIEWNLPPGSYDQVSIYVQKHNEPPLWLSTSSKEESGLIWDQNTPTTTEELKHGPQKQTQYKFLLWKVEDKAQIPGAVVQVGSLNL